MFLSRNFQGSKFRGVVGILALVGAGHAAMGAATEVDKLETAAAGDKFGSAVAVDGDVAIVGAPLADAAYIYRFDGAGWALEAMLPPSGQTADGEFGIAVGISGDVAIVGAWLHGGTGAAYVYELYYVDSEPVWALGAILQADDAEPGDQFGIAVAIDGAVMVVGAPYGDAEPEPNPDVADAGAAYVFGLDGSQQKKLFASDAEVGDQFGCAVDIDGGVIVVGASSGDAGLDPPTEVIDAGAAYVFGLDGVQQTELFASDAPFGVGSGFGASVSISGDTIVVGAPLQHSITADNGAAYIFRIEDGAWQQDEQSPLVLTESPILLNEHFGASVAIAGDLLIVGAPGKDTQIGHAYPYRFDGALWVEGASLKASDLAVYERFGGAVAVSDEERLIVGAADDDVLGDGYGSAYLFELLDTDGDGLTDYDELVYYADLHPCLNPFDDDTDGDEYDDGYEVDMYPIMPAIYDPCHNIAIADADRDGLSDADENTVYLTNPSDQDTDADGLNDGHEVYLAAGTGCPDPREPDSDGDGVLDGSDTEPCEGGGPVDSDGDGLSDDDEVYLYGTDPNEVDSDLDHLSDFVEVDLALANGFSATDIKDRVACPDPWVKDSDGDDLWDGEEVGYDGVPGTGTSPCNPDSDDDGIGDAIDPTPLDPGASGDWIEQELRDTRAVIAVFDLDLIEAKNDNAAKGRRNAMSNKVNGAANAVADGDILSAIDKLTSLLAKLDDDPTPPDWMVPDPVEPEEDHPKQDLRDQIELMIDLLYYEL